MPSDFKIKTPRSREYLDFVRGLPCAMCGAGPRSHAHHVIAGKPKGSDYLTIPLCDTCHRKIHNVGARIIRETEAMSVRQEALRCLHLWVTGANIGNLPREH